MDKVSLMNIAYLYAVFLTSVVEAACPNTAGVVLGSIFGTLAVVAVILGIIALIWKRRNKAAKKKSFSTKKGHTNETFAGDVEMQAGTRQNGSASRDQITDIPTGYVECREYDSPKKDKVVEAATQKQEVAAPKAKRSILDELDGKKKGRRLDFQICKTGSSGSLDAAVTPNDPEVISVSLQSSDIIGLGFNISGSLSEGIFVSQVHNRGPASESGKIKVGDRILSITISMHNMVYEDALTILSYASPYPVKLELQRTMPLFGDGSEDEAKLSHPVYRSQSMDDLSKIQTDKWSGPRKTWSEMRRVHPAKADVDGGGLKKWSRTDDIVQEEMLTMSKAEQSYGQAGYNGQDTTEVDIHSSDEIVVIDVNIPETEDSSSLLDTTGSDQGDHGMKRKSDVPDVSVNIDDSGVVMEPPPNKKLRDSISEDEAVLNGGDDGQSKTENYKMYEVDLNPEESNDGVKKEPQEDTYVVIESETETFESKSGERDRNNSVSSKGSVSSLSSDSINEDKNTVESVEDQKLTVADINENKIHISQEYLEEQIIKTQETDNVSADVHVSDSITSKESSQGPISEMQQDHKEETGVTKAPEKQVKDHDDSVRAVLKDYFGDQPNLLEQFGFDTQKGEASTVRKTVEESTVTKDGDTKTARTETEETTKSEEVKTDDQGLSEAEKAAKARSYQYNKGNKGGMAYYLRIDEGFGGDDGLFGHAYSLNKEQPNLIPVGSEALTTSKTTTVSVTKSTSEDTQLSLVNGPESVPSVGEQVTTGGEA